MPYQLGLPDGSYLEVDDALPLEKARDLALKNFPELFPNKRYGFLETTGRRALESIQETPDLARAAGAVVGIGSYSPEKTQSPIPHARLREALDKPQQVAGEIVGGGLGSLAPSLGAIGAGAAGGAALGSVVPVLGTAAGATIGAAVGGISAAAILNTGDIYKGLLEEGVPQDKAKSIARIVTIPVTALDVVSLGAFSRLMPGVRGAVSRVIGRGVAERMGVEVAEKGAEQIGERYIASRFGNALERHNIALPAGIEAGTEALQQTMQEGANAYGSGTPFLTADRMENIATAGLMGGVGGGVAGGIFGLGLPSVTTDDQQRAINARNVPSFTGDDIRQLGASEAEARMQDIMARTGTPDPDVPLLPAPEPTQEIVDRKLPTKDEIAETVRNPLGDFSSAELGDDLTKRVNANRKDRGLPPLDEFSVEEVAQAGAPRGDIDRLVGIRTEFNPKRNVSTDQIMAAAARKNIVQSDNGFKDFVRRIVGFPDLTTLSQTQRQAVLSTINAMPRFDILTALPVTPQEAPAPKTKAPPQEKGPGVWLPGDHGELQVTSTKTGDKTGHSVYQVNQAEGGPRKRTLLGTFPTQDAAISDAVGRVNDPVTLNTLSLLDQDTRTEEQKQNGVTPGISNANRLIAARARERIGTQEPTGGLNEIETPPGEATPETAGRIKEIIRPREVAGVKEGIEPKLRALETTMRKRLDQLGLKNVKLDIVSTLRTTVKDGAGQERTINPNASYWNNLITVALESKGGFLRALNHESIHALRELGMISEKDWAVLQRKIANQKWLDRPFGSFKTSVRERYKGQNLSPDALMEEAVADMFAAYASGDLYYPGFFSALARKIGNFFEALKNALRGNGFQTGDDVFERIDTGHTEEATREANPEKAPAFSQRDEEKVSTHIINPDSHRKVYYNADTQRGSFQQRAGGWGRPASWARGTVKFIDKADFENLPLIYSAEVSPPNVADGRTTYTISGEAPDGTKKTFPLSDDPAVGKHLLFLGHGELRVREADEVRGVAYTPKGRREGFQQKPLKWSIGDREREDRAAATHSLTVATGANVYYDKDTGTGSRWMDNVSSHSDRPMFFIDGQVFKDHGYSVVEGKTLYGKVSDDGTQLVINDPFEVILPIKRTPSVGDRPVVTGQETFGAWSAVETVEINQQPLAWSIPDDWHAFTRDEHGAPILMGKDHVLADPEFWEEFSGMKFYAHTIREKGSWKPVGTITLGWKGDYPVQVIYMSTRQGGARKGTGEDIVRAILAHNGDDHPLFAMSIMPDAKVFWRKMGGSPFERNGNDNAALTLTTYITNRPAEGTAGPQHSAGSRDEGQRLADVGEFKKGDQYSLGEEEETGTAAPVAELGFEHVEQLARYSLGDKPWYYSELTKQITQLPQNAAPPEQWKSIIANLNAKGVKKDEIEWSGINDWLDIYQRSMEQSGTKRSVPKNDILQYLAENGIRVHESVLGEPPAPPKVHSELPPGYTVEMRRLEIPIPDLATRLSAEYDKIAADATNIVARIKADLGTEGESAYEAKKKEFSYMNRSFLNYVWQVTKKGKIDPEAGYEFMPFVELMRKYAPGMFPEEVVGNQLKKYKREWVVWREDGGSGEGREWTEAQDRSLLAAHDAGRNISDLATSYGRTQADVANRLVMYGRATEGDVAYAEAMKPNETDAKKRTVFNIDKSEPTAVEGAIAMLNVIEEQRAAALAKETVYKEYTIKKFDSEGYRELLLQFPRAEEVQQTPVEAKKEDFTIKLDRSHALPIYEVYNKFGEKIDSFGNLDGARSQITMLVEGKKHRRDKIANYKAPHFHGNEMDQNLLAHIRFTAAESTDKHKILFVEEFQSDWAQDYREKQYTKSDLHPGEKLSDGVWSFTTKTEEGDWVGLGDTEEAARANVLALLSKIGRKATEADVPKAPFITNTTAWVALSMKRAVRWAVEKGFDGIAWTNGNQQAVRYGRNEARQFGMTEFYDKIVPNVANNDVLKKLGGGKVIQIKMRGFPETPVLGKFAGRQFEVVHRSTGYVIKDTVNNKYYDIDGRFSVDVQTYPTYEDAERVMVELRKKAEEEAATLLKGQLGFLFNDTMKEKALAGLPLFSLPDQMATAERSDVLRNVAYSFRDIAEGIDRFIKPLGKADQLRTIFQDRMLPVKRLHEEIEAKGGTISEAMDSYLREELFHGRVGDRIGDNEKVLYKPLIHGLKRSNVELGDFEDYLYARHAPERNAYLAARTGAQNGAGVTDEQSATVKADLEAKYGIPILSDLAAKFDAIIEDTNRVRQTGYLTDLYDPAAGFKHYAPLRSFEEDPDEKPDVPAWRRTGLLADVRGPEDPKMKGRKTKAQNLLAAAIMQNEMAIIRAEKNGVGRAFADMVRNIKPEGMRIIETNPNPNSWIIDGDGLLRVRQSNYYYDRSTLVLKEPDPTRPGKIMETAIRIEDQRVADAIKGINPQSSEVGGFIVRQLGRLNRWLSLVNTGMNPEFLVSNLIRDLQTAGVVIQGTDYKGTAGVLVKQVPAAVRGIWKVIREDPSALDDPYSRLFSEMSEAGGRTYFLGIKDVGDKMREIQKMMSEVKEGNPLSVKNAMRSVERFVEDINQVFENATRLSAYKIAKENGATTDKAASLAKNITVNFTRGGQMKTLFNSMYLFYNASLQGSFVIVNALKSPTVRKVVAGIVLGGAMLDALNRALSGDDDDGENAYDKLMRTKPYVGEHFMVVMVPGEKKYMALPMPYGFNAFYNLGRNLSAVLSGKAKPADAAKSILFTGVDAFNPLGGTESFLTFVAPTVADPFVELATNRNFAGQKITPEGSPYSPYKKPDSQLFWSNTAVPYVKIAEWMNKLTGGTTAIPGLVDISPETMEYWVEYAGGATAKFVERSARFGYKALTGDLESVEVGQIPFLRKAVGSLDKRGNLESYYNRAADVLTAKAEMKAAVAERDPERLKAALQKYGPQLAVADFFERTDRRLADLRSQKRKIQNDSQIPAEFKHTLVDRLEKNMDTILLNANRVYLTVVEKKKPTALAKREAA